MKFIAVCGLNGSGKGMFAEIVKKHYPEMIYISARELIYKAAEKAGVNITDRDGLRVFNEDRAAKGRLLVHDILDMYSPMKENGIYIFESLRRVAEIKQFKDVFIENFIVLGVDANEALRYERITSRGTETDKVSLEKFREQERLENESLDDNVMNVKRCMSMADRVFLNEGSIEEFEFKVLEFMKSIVV